MSNLSLELARRGLKNCGLKNYSHRADELMSGPAEAMTCEDLLQLGIDTYADLQTSERMQRAVAREGLPELTEDDIKDLETAYRKWLLTFERAEQWVDMKGCTPHNLERFQDARRRVQGIVAANTIRAAIDAPYTEQVFDSDCTAALLAARKQGDRCAVPLIQIPTS